MSLEETFRKVLFEKIEYEFDLVATQEAYEEYIYSSQKSRSISELWKELD